MRKSIGIVLGLVIGSAACAPPPKTVRVAAASPKQASDGVAVSTTTLAAAVTEAPSPAEIAPAPESIPSACEAESTVKDAKLCVAPKAFTKKLCSGVYPEVALAMFSKSTPWTRLWLSGDVDAWNASGGLTHRAKLAFDEEVVVLSKHGAAQSGGIVMTGSMASYDVLRLDGTCVSVMEGELTTRRPPVPRPAPVPFRRLEEPTRHALLAAPKLETKYAAVEKACNTGDKKSCEKAEKALSQAVLDHVKSGAALPEPARRP